MTLATITPEELAERQAVRQIASGIHNGDLVSARRLWNAIDHMGCPESLWAIMRSALPWAFRDAADSNSVR